MPIQVARILHVLVVEDHDDLREATVTALASKGLRVRGVDCAEVVDQEMDNFPADILVLDVNLPGESGLELAQRLRSAEPGIGIVMVTARNRPMDRIAGYNSGADLYLAKPVAPDELHAAIQALAKRLRASPASVQPLILNTTQLQLYGAEVAVDISSQEAAMLKAFADAPDYRLGTAQMLAIAGDATTKSTLEVQIVRLRKKLEQAGVSGPTVKAIRGIGYQLCVPLILNDAR